jgi:hypothetical protein
MTEMLSLVRVSHFIEVRMNISQDTPVLKLKHTRHPVFDIGAKCAHQSHTKMSKTHDGMFIEA